MAVTVAVTMLLSANSVRESRQVISEFTEQVTPPSTSMSLLAPASQDWWEVAKAMGDANSGMKDIDLPSGATWVGYSEGASTNKQARDSKMLTVFYAGFDSHRAAENYLRSEAITDVGARASGSVVEFVPAYTTFSDESFPKKAPQVVDAPSVAVWTINFTEHFEHLESISRWKSTKEFFEGTGLRGSKENPVVWTGTSDDPRGVFSGDVKNASKSNVMKMLSAGNDSATLLCDEGMCEEKVPGLNGLSYGRTFFFKDKDGQFGDRPAEAADSPFKDDGGVSVGFVNWAVLAYTVANTDTVIASNPLGFDFMVDGSKMKVAPAWADDTD
ncbi:hypothetical protein [Aeromicrobium sp. 179-A 4D2 NHS]|uniref:hypothetical protein n=1 Tax=Aeromicrobium sp. 179-A 4D2 NHS TaxID=3142375 RepID=UPI00399FBD46